jgi:hypothetical protein
MTASPESARWAHFEQRWRDRLSRFAVAEVMGGALIVVLWAGLATINTGSIPLVVLAVGIGLWIHLGAVETGNHTMAWLSTGLVLVYIVIGLSSLPRDFGPVSYTLASCTALAHNELVRVSYARRRQAHVQEEVYVGSATGVALASLVAVVGIGLAEQMSRIAERSWLWVPAAAAALLVMVVALTVLPARKAPRARRQRWRPGDRMPPPPLGQETPDDAGWG